MPRGRRTRGFATAWRVVVRLLPIVGVAAMSATLPAAAAETCDDVMRQIKLDVFDQEWNRVGEQAAALLSRFPDCPHRQQAAFLRARAMERTGRDEQALDAYHGFLKDWCRRGTESLDCNLAQTTLFDLAARLHRKSGGPEHLNILLDGLKQPGDAGTFAALTLADMRDVALQFKALPRLLAAWESDLDEDVRNRVCLAILTIDPTRAPCGQRAGGDADSGAPTLISVEVFNKETNRPEIRINMPVALAEMLINSLPALVHEEMAREGIDVQQIFQAVRDQARGTVFEAETPEVHIRIWLQ